MNILKIQLKNKDAAIKCAAYLLKENVTCVRLGAAVVVLSTMHNTGNVAVAIVDNEGHTVEPNKYDKSKLLEVI